MQPWEQRSCRQHLRFASEKQLGQHRNVARICKLAVTHFGACRPNPAHHFYLGCLSSASGRSSCHGVCQAQHISALCACPHDRVAAASGCLCLLAVEKIFAEWPPQNSAITGNWTSKYFATGATGVRWRVTYYIHKTLVRSFCQMWYLTPANTCGVAGA